MTLTIDERDVHFHPNLQAIVLDAIDNICNEKILLATSDSPTLMLSVEPERLYFLQHHSETDWDCEENQNQITKLTDDMELMDSLAQMYTGFTNDLRLATHYANFANAEILRYASQCLKSSEPVNPEDTKDSDPQVTAFRSILLCLSPGANIVEVGVEKGRLLRAFETISPATLGTMSYIGIDSDEDAVKSLENYCSTLKVRNLFREFHIQKALESDQFFDLCILANIIHEVGSDKLAEFLNGIFRHANKRAVIFILEAAELAVGENDFIVQDDHAIKEILRPFEESGFITTASARPRSYGGTPLIELHITVLNANMVCVTDDDIIRGLQTVIKPTADKLQKHWVGETRLSARALSFRCHNLANTTVYLELLKQNETLN